jgi:endonuclease-3
VKPAAIEKFFARLARANPAPKGELNYTNPYTLLVAVVLSAQSTDKGVNKATPKLFAVAGTPQAMLDLGEAGLREHVKTIGLYNTKAKNIIKLSQILRDQYGGTVPPDRAALESLPGVGRKTANVVLNIAFGQPTIAVDTHIFRVCNRTGLARGRTPLEVEKGLERAVPASYRLHAHHWLILHGRYVCLARNPKCGECAVSDLCAFKGKGAASLDQALGRNTTPGLIRPSRHSLSGSGPRRSRPKSSARVTRSG